jgi:hypothetical protein
LKDVRMPTASRGLPRASALAGPLLVPVVVGILVVVGAAPASAEKAGACTPSPMVLKAAAAPVRGLSAQQVDNATAIINAASRFHVPERGQTLAVMTALEASSLGERESDQSQGAGALGLFGPTFDQKAQRSRPEPTAAAQDFYRALKQVKGWQNMPPTLASHAAMHNLNPDVYTRWWPQAQRVVNALTTGTGTAGLANLAARAQQIAKCEAATAHGQFAVDAGTPYVGPIPPAALIGRAQELAAHGGNGWFDRCQHFVAVLAGRPSSGYSTALDAWQTFEAGGVAHLVTGPDGVTPPVGAWLYYRDATNPAGHVVTYLGNGQIASTDVFSRGRVGVGPASAITDGPWHMEYLGWAAPWGRS